MWWISEPMVSLPLYMLIVFLLYKNYSLKTTVLLILLAGLCVALADLSAKHLFKDVFLRYRPSHNHNIKNQLHIINEYRGGTYGFVSSHAANMFAIGMFVFITLRKKIGKWALFFLLWACIVSYSRVYLGVHYPSDVFVGGLLGVSIVGLVRLIFYRIWPT